MTTSLDDVLSFARAHCVHLGSSAAAAASSSAPSLPADQLRHDVRVRPLFDAQGQATRLKASQAALLARSSLDRMEEAGKASRDPPRRVNKKKTSGPPPTAGKKWFDVPNTPLTPEAERTFQVLQMRPYMFKDRHYKRTATAEIPEFFAMGTIVDDPLDYHSTRVHKRYRKQT